MIAVGMWRNFDELEDSLTLEELMELYEAVYEREERSNKFMAAVVGVEYGGGSSEEVVSLDYAASQIGVGIQTIGE